MVRPQTTAMAKLRISPGRACYCDVGSVVRAHLAAAEKGRTGHNYILGGSEASYSEIVQMVGKLLGQRTNTRIGRPLVLRSAGRVSEWISKITGKEPRISAESAAIVCGSIICRSDKAMRELDYRPTSLETMFRDCIGWSPRTSSASRRFAARPCLPWVPRLLDGKWTNG